MKTPRTARLLAQRRPVIAIEAPESGAFSCSVDGAPLVRRGDHVTRGRLLCLITADNAVHEIESPTAGRLVNILVKDGSSVAYGEALFLVRAADDTPGAVTRRVLGKSPVGAVGGMASAGGHSSTGVADPRAR